MDSPPRSLAPREPVCPPAPMKPNLRQQQAQGRYDAALELARDSLIDMNDGERAQALSHLPRHALPGVFLAFCDWQTSRHPQPFMELLAYAPNLHNDITSQAMQAFPGLTWQDWCNSVTAAVSDHGYGQQMAESFACSVYSPARRVLDFS